MEQKSTEISQKQAEVNEKIKEQILMAEDFLTRARKSMDACEKYSFYARFRYPKEAKKHIEKCGAAGDLTKEIRLFVAEPELSKVKENLLIVANLVDEFSILVTVYPEEYAKKADSLTSQFLEAFTKTREEILKIKRKYNLE